VRLSKFRIPLVLITGLKLHEKIVKQRVKRIVILANCKDFNIIIRLLITKVRFMHHVIIILINTIILIINIINKLLIYRYGCT